MELSIYLVRAVSLYIWFHSASSSEIVAGSTDVFFSQMFENQNSRDSRTSHAVWNKILNQFLPSQISYIIDHKYLKDFSSTSTAFVTRSDDPMASVVLVVHSHLPSDFMHAPERSTADCKIRSHISVLQSRVDLPVLHGICAFGTKIAFYSYHKVLNYIRRNPVSEGIDWETEMDSVSWWLDITEQEGADKFRAVMEEVKVMASEQVN